MDERALLTRHWPLFGLAVRTPRLELRYPTDADLVALADLSGDIHDPDFLPFASAWSLLPDGERQRGLLQFHWGRRGDWKPECWRLELVTVVDGQVVGTQGLMADDFVVARTVTSGSWIGRAHQGTGIGTEMRSAVLHLAFEGLGALRAETAAVDGNDASLAVTRKLGYRPNGDRYDATDGKRTRELAFVLDRADWEPTRRSDIELVGLAPCLALFGLGSAPGDAVA